MTNKKFRDDLAKEMRDKYNERNKRLEEADNFPVSDGLKEQMKKEIMRNFEKEMDDMKIIPGYKEAKESHLEEIKAKNAVKKAKKEYDESLKRYENAQLVHRGGVEKKTENDAENSGKLSQEKKEKLQGDKETILKDLKENYVQIEENAEMMGYKGKKVHINLPAVGNFEGFKFEYFVSDNKVYKYNFESNPELEKKSYSMKDVGGLLGAMNKYMQAMGIETDGDMDYENDLKCWETEKYRCNAGDCLKQIAGLDLWYWLKDKNVDGIGDSRALWNCDDDICYFSRYDDDGDANLFLRLSD